MNDNAVGELLKQLHSKLDGTTTVSEADRELLRRLSTDIQALLSAPTGAAGPQHESLAARIGDAILHFEVSHPDITTVLGGVSKALGDMGI